MFLNTILIYENNVILKTFYGFDITRINYIFKYIKAEDSYLKLFLKKHNITVSPPGTSSCVETLGERHQRCPALNHMCNQSKLTARRQVR